MFVHWTANPAHTEEWASKQYERYSGPGFWNMEMEGRPDALDGLHVYPEFGNVHIIPDDWIPARGCLFMAIDPHPRTPHAMLWVLIDRFSDWYIYRENWPSIVYGQDAEVTDKDRENRYTVRDYCDFVARIEGNRIRWEMKETDLEYGVFEESPRGEKIIDRFMDQAGKGFRASAEDAQVVETLASRYAKFGIICRDPVKDHQVGEEAIHALLKLRHHDLYNMWPRLHIASSCVETILELSNLRYPVQRRDDKELKQDPIELRRHMVDLLRYLATSDIGYYEGMESARYTGPLE